ncbi:MAG: TIR domain-containing protein [Pseudomonas oryzihabitans]
MFEKVFVESVYKTSGIPTYTFVEPAEYTSLLISLRSPGKCSIIEGPSGIGKTTCVLKILESLNSGKETTLLSGRNPSHKQRISEVLKDRPEGFFIIDDFHRLSDDHKIQFADYMKLLADIEDPNRKIVAIGINKAGKTLIDYAHDLTDRLDFIKFEANSDSKILEMIGKGEDALNVSLLLKQEIAENSHGSLQIAQSLCLQACIEAGAIERTECLKEINVSYQFVKEKVIDTISMNFFPKAKKFSSGKRIRPEGRAPYLMLLYWLSSSDDWSISVDDILSINPSHKGSVGQIVEKGFLTEHISENEDIQAVLHFDQQSGVLAIEDPKFMFYIKNIAWSNFCRQVGFKGIDFPQQYDFALSFAGEVRGIAEALTAKLQERELNIFYDFQEQHRILAQNVEDYLAPIYRSESQFVVALLSTHYPKKVWTRFESSIFESRFGENSVIPIFIDCEPSTFDKAANVGNLFIDSSKSIENQINSIVDTLSKKIIEHRQ